MEAQTLVENSGSGVRNQHAESQRNTALGRLLLSRADQGRSDASALNLGQDPYQLELVVIGFVDDGDRPDRPPTLLHDLHGQLGEYLLRAGLLLDLLPAP